MKTFDEIITGLSIGFIAAVVFVAIIAVIESWL